MMNLLEKLTGPKPDFGTNSSITLRVDWIRKHYKVDFDVYLPTYSKNLQRPLVWTVLQKQQLILSILKGVYIPNISAVEVVGADGETVEFQIIDGKQRMSAVFAYLDGQFPLVDSDGNEHYYSDLPKAIQVKVSRYHFRINVVYSDPENRVTDQQKVEWFKFINFAGTAQDNEHMKQFD